MNKEILWLPSWYPNKIDPFDGDFIQRHAYAVSLHKKIHVIFARPDESGKITNSVQADFIQRKSHRTNHLLQKIRFFFRKNKFFFKMEKASKKGCTEIH